MMSTGTFSTACASLLIGGASERDAIQVEDSGDRRAGVSQVFFDKRRIAALPISTLAEQRGETAR